MNKSQIISTLQAALKSNDLNSVQLLLKPIVSEHGSAKVLLDVLSDLSVNLGLSKEQIELLAKALPKFQYGDALKKRLPNVESVQSKRKARKAELAEMIEDATKSYMSIGEEDDGTYFIALNYETDSDNSVKIENIDSGYSDLRSAKRMANLIGRQIGVKGETVERMKESINESISSKLKAKMIKDLVKLFGKEEKEEIEKTFDDENDTFETSEGEYKIIENEEEAIRLAREDIENIFDDMGLESFSPKFQEQIKSEMMYITDTDKRIMAGEDADMFVEDRDDDEILDYAKEYLDKDEKEKYEALEEAGEKEKAEKLISNLRDELVHHRYEEIYKELDTDPAAYFDNIGGKEMVDSMIKRGYFHVDLDKIKDACIEMDGWAHFISRYDGEYKETENGYIVIREN